MTRIPKGEAFLPQHTKEELTELYRKEKNSKAKMRLLVAVLRKKGMTYEEISERVQLPLMTVADWCSRLHEEGIERRYDKKQLGRPRKLTDEQLTHLRSVVLDSPQKVGLPFSSWTTKLARDYIEREYNVSYKARQVQNILHAFGMTCQKPRPQHRKANKKAQDELKKTSKKESDLTSKMDFVSSFWTKASSR